MELHDFAQNIKNDKGASNNLNDVISQRSLTSVFQPIINTSDPRWKKEGVSSDDAVSALSECKYQVGLNKVTKSEQNELVQNCMQAKGFRWRAD